LRQAIAFIADFHAKWSVFRLGIRAVARMESSVAEALQQSRVKQLALLADASGLSLARKRAELALILGIVERLSETLSEGGDRDAVLDAAERAIGALLPRR
jgi:hypothetical protein